MYTESQNKAAKKIIFISLIHMYIIECIIRANIAGKIKMRKGKN